MAVSCPDGPTCANTPAFVVANPVRAKREAVVSPSTSPRAPASARWLAIRFVRCLAQRPSASQPAVPRCFPSDSKPRTVLGKSCSPSRPSLYALHEPPAAGETPTRMVTMNSSANTAVLAASCPGDPTSASTPAIAVANPVSASKATAVSTSRWEIALPISGALRVELNVLALSTPFAAMALLVREVFVDGLVN